MKNKLIALWNYNLSIQDKVIAYYKRGAVEKLHVVALSLFIGLLLYIHAVRIDYFFLFGSMPSLKSLENPKMNLASEIYTTDEQLIGKYYSENRKFVPFSKIAPCLVQTLLATEDTRFYEHSGIDFQSVIGIFWYAIKGDNRGGSTLSQQLAKNLFKTREMRRKGVLGFIPGINLLISKTKEWIVAVQLESNFSKEEIITMYLNTVDFGLNTYGIYAASESYFSTTPDSLSYNEAAVLVGLLKDTSSYKPVLNPDKSLFRRNTVLDQVVIYGGLQADQADSIKKEPIRLKRKNVDYTEGVGSYFRTGVNQELEQLCKELGYDLYTDGLKIYTTIDSRMQEAAEDAVRKHMKRLQQKFDYHWQGRNPWIDENGKEIEGFLEEAVRSTSFFKKVSAKYKNQPDSVINALHKRKRMTLFTWKGEMDTMMSTMDSLKHYKHLLQAGFVTINPNNGHIITWVGGIDYKYFQYDHVKQSKRQPGSTFKPFVYAAAIDRKGYSPCDKIMDQPTEVKYVENGEAKVWTPRNSDRVFTYREMTLRRAIGKSVNTVTAQLTEKIGWGTVIQFAKDAGIKSPLRNVPSIGLGSSDVNLLELTSAYAPFVNTGYYVEPTFILKIVDRTGKTIYEHQPKKKRIMTEESSFLMQYMLRGGIEEPGGTLQALWEFGDIFRRNQQFAGKTGTSNNYSDGWFIGISKDLISGMWVGGEDRCIHFRTSQEGEASQTALPMYGYFMEAVFKNPEFGITMGPFPQPKIKINKPYYCPTPYIPEEDSTAKADTLVLTPEQIETSEIIENEEVTE